MFFFSQSSVLFYVCDKNNKHDHKKEDGKRDARARNGGPYLVRILIVLKTIAAFQARLLQSIPLEFRNIIAYISQRVLEQVRAADTFTAPT